MASPRVSRVYLLRHATAKLGADQEDHHLFSTLNERLGEKGESEAQEVAAALADAPLEAVYASPTERTVHTAEVVAERHGLGVEVDERLVEVHVKPPGTPYEEIMEAILEIPLLFQRDPDPVLPNGERVSEARARFEAALDAVATRHDVAAVVAHGLINRVWLAPHLQLTPDEMLVLDQDHASVNVLDKGEAGWHVAAVNVPAARLHPMLRKK